MSKYLIGLFFTLLLFGCQPAQKQLVIVPPPAQPVADQTATAVVPEESAPTPAVVEADRSEDEFKPEYVLPRVPALPEAVDAFLDEAPPLPYNGDFPLDSHQRVEKLIERYTGSQKKTFTRWLERAGRYIPRIQMVFASEGIPLDLAYLAMIESGFNVRAYSWAHAAGPWQFIESTGRLYGLENDWWQDGRLDIEKSTHAAARHLKYLHKRFDGNWYLAVAAYNAGGGKVRSAIRDSGSRDFWKLVDGRVLREETKNYLPKLLATLSIVKDLESYGFVDLDFESPLEYETITLESSTDLEIIADFAGVSYQELKELNPELKRWCTPPGVKDYRLHVPYGSATEILERYTALPSEQRARYHRHQIKAGDTLQALAKKYRIRVDDIIALNDIKNPRAIQIGTNLILPLKEGFSRLPVDELADSYVRSHRRTYKVRSGDSLWSIARRFSVTEKELRVWNKLGWSNILRPGQVLAVSRAGATRSTASSSSPRATSRELKYKVRSGDSLWTIARRFSISQTQLRAWNGLGGSDMIHPGQILAVSEVGAAQIAKAGRQVESTSTRKLIYKVLPGDTLWDISRQFDVATEQILHWNELSEGHILQPGQKLTLMVAASQQG